MVALHDGHGALLDEARQRCSVLSPRYLSIRSSLIGKAIMTSTLGSSMRMWHFAQREECSIFAPQNHETYPEPQSVFVDVEDISEHLCGRSRSGHFGESLP